MGRYFTKSPTLLNLSLVSLFLNLDWLIGFMLSNKVKKELHRIHFRNLNGGTGFELLMVYCQMQILITVALFITVLYQVSKILTEMRELETLSIKQDGALWEKEFNLMSVSAVEVQLGVFFFMQLLLFMVVMAVLIGFVKSGLKWGDH